MTSFQSIESASVLRYVVLIAFFFSIFIVLFGSLNNVATHKYVRAISIKSCRKPILNINEKNSLLCCDHDKHLENSICHASYDRIGHIFSSKYALLIPFAPTVIHTLNDIILNIVHNKSKRVVFEKILTSAILKLIIVGLILFFRTVSIIILQIFVDKYIHFRICP